MSSTRKTVNIFEEFHREIRKLKGPAEEQEINRIKEIKEALLKERSVNIAEKSLNCGEKPAITFSCINQVDNGVSRMSTPKEYEKCIQRTWEKFSERQWSYSICVKTIEDKWNSSKKSEPLKAIEELEQTSNRIFGLR